MDFLETTIILVSSSLFLCLLLFLTNLLHKIWWTPISIKHMMRSQAIRGPPYRFIHGNNKDIVKMKIESMSRPMDLSHDIFPKVLPHQHSWLNTYGKNFLFWRGSRAQLVISESKLVKEILNNKEKAYPKTETEGYLKKLFGDGLSTSEGEKWEKQRKLANHAFHAHSLKNMIPAMVESVEVMLERWKQHESKEIEVSEEFRILTSEIISRTAFASSYLERKDIFEMLMKLILPKKSLCPPNFGCPNIHLCSKIRKSSNDIESKKLEQRIRDSIIRMMNKREKEMTEVNNLGRTDLLGLLVEANNNTDENNRLTLDDVVDECKTFYIAGHETTTTLISWTVLLLAIHTDWQDKAREEVFELFDQKHPNAEGIARMKMMNMIANECLRLCPPVTNFTRKVKRKIKLGNPVLPGNMNLSIPTLALHRDPQVWGEDVHLFKPERFEGGVAKATNKNPAAYLPFGFGPRSCVGTTFATNEAKIALAMILQRYAFTLSPTYVHSPMQSLTVRPKHGIQVMLHAL
ncbi:cytochrome P450 CYP749A22-like [Actinidia eriantha]|uniref:cytochrome P450 CYP749A22-like n=1 Tax=Actinidia eriantha TaxID=165200 RepID=UPI00258C5177|nr:cytochrome P450 CYP749A22-like [Actinidia eriantha]